ncbi:MAG TPA: outer membrane lipoprotein LolB [Halothiobacillaceae bacterium]|nr:outer membrane lipoprotein LolB [Halothiobacillaceae bacterium]
MPIGTQQTSTSLSTGAGKKACTQGTAGLLAGLLFLSGCSHIPAPSLDRPPQEYTPEQMAQFKAHQQALEQLTHWAVAARGAVRDSTQGGSFALRWEQSLDYSEVDLSGPFGQGQMYLAGTPEYMAIGYKLNHMRISTTPERWIEENTGWPVPIAALPVWLIGQADPSAEREQIQINNAGLIVQQYADGWQIRYDRYQTHNGLSLPGLIEVSRDDLRLRILIDNWQIQCLKQPAL